LACHLDTDADPESAYHFEADPDADPDPDYHSAANLDADPNPTFQIDAVHADP
jgi:hypothetical protein